AGAGARRTVSVAERLHRRTAAARTPAARRRPDRSGTSRDGPARPCPDPVPCRPARARDRTARAGPGLLDAGAGPLPRRTAGEPAAAIAARTPGGGSGAGAADAGGRPAGTHRDVRPA